MLNLGQVNDREIIYIKHDLETEWYKDFPKDSWLLFAVADYKQTTIFDEIARRSIDNNVAYVCAAGKECEKFHDTFDEVLAIREVENEYLPDYLIMTTWHKNFEEGFWFASTVAITDEQEIKTIVCLDITTQDIQTKLKDLITKLNCGWVPADT